MKRLIFALFFLVVGGGIGGGGLYVGLNWDQFNPFKKPTGDLTLNLVAQLRRACANDEPLKGATVKSARIADGKLALAGLVARNEQKAALEAKANSLLAEDPELAKQCSAGVSTDAILVFAIHDHLTQLQKDFDEGRGAEAVMREAMRTTRLDGLSYSEDGKLTVTGVCVRGDSKTHATDDLLAAAIKDRLGAAGVAPSAMPELVLKVQYFANPATLVQKKLDKDERAKDVRLTAAWFDGAGKLHVEGIVAKDEQRKLVEDSVLALLKETASQAMAKGATDYSVRLVTFAGDTRVIELQKQWVEHARKSNKPYLQHVRLEITAPAVLLTDDEGNASYAFQIKGRLLETASERKEIETELAAWLQSRLPKVLNQNQTNVSPQLALDVRPSPIFALQERVVQRGLDGAVFTDARFDEAGRLELVGRWQQPNADGKQALNAAVKDLLAAETSWTLDTMQAHESTKQGQPIAWQDVERQCQMKLALNTPLSQRVRLDRLHYRYENKQLVLAGDGAFLADSATEQPAGALSRAVDDVIASRGQVAVSTANFKLHKNPIADLQNLTGQRADLDGVLLTNLRYGPDGALHVDGFLGQPEHKNSLTSILAAKLTGLIRKGNHAKAADWSLDGMKLHASAKGEVRWPDFIRACQAELAADPQAATRRACLERAYFKYIESQAPGKDGAVRMLLLEYAGKHLVKPQDEGKENVVADKIAGVAKLMLPGAAIAKLRLDLESVPTPIYDLQKVATELKLDGLFFQDAAFDREGKLTLSGVVASVEQLKHAKGVIDAAVGGKDNKKQAPFGVGALDNFKVVAWQPIVDELKAQFAGDPSALFRQTRLDRGYYGYDAKHHPVISFQGICIYQGKVPVADTHHAVLAERLTKQLQTKGVTGFEVRVAGIERKSNPHGLLQDKANQNELNGVVFNAIGFDAKGACYVRLPFVPAGQADSVRKLIDDFAKQYPHLRGIQQR